MKIPPMRDKTYHLCYDCRGDRPIATMYYKLGRIIYPFCSVHFGEALIRYGTRISYPAGFYIGFDRDSLPQPLSGSVRFW